MGYADLDEKKCVAACTAISMAVKRSVEAKTPGYMPVELVVGSLLAVAMQLVEATDEARTDEENGVAFMELVKQWTKNVGYGGALRPDGVRAH